MIFMWEVKNIFSDPLFHLFVCVIMNVCDFYQISYITFLITDHLLRMLSKLCTLNNAYTKINFIQRKSFKNHIHSTHTERHTLTNMTIIINNKKNWAFTYLILLNLYFSAQTKNISNYKTQSFGWMYSMDIYGYRYRYVINVNESNDWIIILLINFHFKNGFKIKFIGSPLGILKLGKIFK